MGSPSRPRRQQHRHLNAAFRCELQKVGPEVEPRAQAAQPLAVGTCQRATHYVPLRHLRCGDHAIHLHHAIFHNEDITHHDRLPRACKAAHAAHRFKVVRHQVSDLVGLSEFEVQWRRLARARDYQHALLCPPRVKVEVS
eukprot:CAMPEP_0177631674 /NCGR_PEP_ID=MMETSP0447-20121125/1875_1 /TAXON_ID=0 /ORGANISM="Stygamoeba regulata, Strain BSH-02190019" /LENGTH=139 /DNA_ID=CAMNT_0019133173 /DNA_START=417 /DNA_END=833 /DNA_ORIENTATION=+